MATFPAHTELPVQALSGLFRHTTNSYKFYWFWALLEEVKSGRSLTVVPIDKLLIKMLSLSWYTVNYYRVSLGPSDKLQQLVREIEALSALRPESTAQEVEQTLLQLHPRDARIRRKLKQLGQYVPYRFLTSFFPTALRGLSDSAKHQQIVNLAAQYFTVPKHMPLYKFVGNALAVPPAWQAYLVQHYAILLDFCHWNFIQFLQARNPNMPNISRKLFAPPLQRDMKHGLQFWRIYLMEHSMQCIYSKEPIEPRAFSLDHFIPWSFVAHDLVWNLIPTPSHVNSSKSDHLPDLNQYLTPFAQLHYEAFQTVLKAKRYRLLEDYVLSFQDDLAHIAQYSKLHFTDKMTHFIRPIAQIAAHAHFPAHWQY